MITLLSSTPGVLTLLSALCVLLTMAVIEARRNGKENEP